MKTRIYTLFILLIAALLFTACAAPVGEISLGAEDNGLQVELDEGWVLVISLESNPSTGFGWHVADIDEAVLKQVGEVEFVAVSGDEELVGAPGIEVLRFEAVGSGTGTLTLTYDRVWEDVAPGQTYTLTVTVP